MECRGPVLEAPQPFFEEAGGGLVPAGRRGPRWGAPRPLPLGTLGAAAQGARAAALALFSPRLLVLTPGT